jgi:hypothetical protein
MHRLNTDSAAVWMTKLLLRRAHTPTRSHRGVIAHDVPTAIEQFACVRSGSASADTRPTQPSARLTGERTLVKRPIPLVLAFDALTQGG